MYVFCVSLLLGFPRFSLLEVKIVFMLIEKKTSDDCSGTAIFSEDCEKVSLVKFIGSMLCIRLNVWLAVFAGSEPNQKVSPSSGAKC